MPDIDQDSPSLLLRAVVRILHPVVRILLRNGIACRVMEEAIRKVYVDEAFRIAEREGRRATVSGVAAKTGLSRKEVARLRELQEGPAIESRQRYNRAIRVISGWMNDERFLDETGGPRVLPLDGEADSFQRLCRDYSGDVTMRSMLELLLEAGSVEIAEGGVRLVRRAYVPGGEPADIIDILATDVSELIETIDFNMQADPSERRFQRKVAYTDIPRARLDEFKALTALRAQALLEELDGWLSGAESEALPDEEKRRVAVAVYYHESEDGPE